MATVAGLSGAVLRATADGLPKPELGRVARAPGVSEGKAKLCTAPLPSSPTQIAESSEAIESRLGVIPAACEAIWEPVSGSTATSVPTDPDAPGTLATSRPCWASQAMSPAAIGSVLSEVAAATIESCKPELAPPPGVGVETEMVALATEAMSVA